VGQAGSVPVRLPVVALVLALGLTVGVVGLTLVPSGSPAAPGRSVPSRSGVPVVDERVAVAALHAWDERRAAAWAQGDRDALSRLYTRTSTAGRADARLLGLYAVRGLVVRHMRMQVLRLRVLVAQPSRIVLDVTDRLAGAVAVRVDDDRVRRALPADGPTSRRLVLRRDGEQWLMAGVSASAP
jgi:hypothetical protein